MKLLIYGAGVIGSLYAALFSEAGFDVSLYARGKRLDFLKKNGLLYRRRGGVRKGRVRILEQLPDQDLYSFIFLAVREEQALPALQELSRNKSPVIVTMINTARPYDSWEAACGAGRLLPAFPGAGGGIEESGVLDAALTPRIIQPTTFGEITGEKSGRIRTLARIFRQSRIPYQIVPDMYHWQVSHLGLVVPLADACLKGDPQRAWQNRDLMAETARRLKDNFRLLAERRMLSPRKLHLLRSCPLPLLAPGLSFLFRSDFARRFMYSHAMKAPEEMRRLHELFYDFISR